MIKIPVPKKNSIEYHWIAKTVEVIIINWRGKIYVARSICPHMGARLEFDEDTLSLRCPWHGLSFDLETLGSQNQRFRTLSKINFSLDDSFINIDF